jgi:hypothetical protein
MFQHCDGGPLTQVYRVIFPLVELAVAHSCVGTPAQIVMSGPALTVGKGITVMVI